MSKTAKAFLVQICIYANYPANPQVGNEPFSFTIFSLLQK